MSPEADIDALKLRLDALRPVRRRAWAAILSANQIELSWASNAIEGNTLTQRETAELVEHGITVGGKPLGDHLEAVDHYDALGWVLQGAGPERALNEDLVCELHRRIVARSRPDIAGFYSTHPRRIAGSMAVFPAPAKIPGLMASFGDWLSAAPRARAAAWEALWGLVVIHPFSDGNGRTARLLMNLILIRAGYPPVSVRPEDRSAYLDALEACSAAGTSMSLSTVLDARLLDTLAGYVEALEQSLPETH